MKKNLLLIVFLISSGAYAQTPCCTGMSAGHDTVVCKDSVQLHATPFKGLAEVVCMTSGSLQSDSGYEIGFTINGSVSAGENGACGQNSFLMIAVIDSVCLQAWDNCNKEYGQQNIYLSSSCQAGDFTYETCRTRSENYFEFSFNDSVQMDSAASMLTNRIPDGDFILAYSYESYDYSTLNPVLANAFTNIGFSSFDTLKQVPFIFFVKKGNPITAMDAVGVGANDTISLYASFSSSVDTSNIIFSWSPGKTLNDSTLKSPLAFPQVTTVYYLTATDTVAHCSTVDSVTVYYNCANGIKDYAKANWISISPNPVSNLLNIHFIAFLSNETATLSVMNVLGEIILEDEIKWSNDIAIDVKTLPAGIYFLQLKSGADFATKRFVKV